MLLNLVTLWDYSDTPGGGRLKIKGPAHMIEGDYHLRKIPQPPPMHNVTGLGNIN